MALLEREPLLDALAEALKDAAAGRGSTVLVSGEAGIGKTSLVEHFVERERPARVLWGGCEALSTPGPLGPLHDVAAQSGAALRALLAGRPERPALFAAALDELARPPSPAVLVFEDVHWADDATLDLVKYVGRRIQRLPALFVLTHRDDAASLAALRPVLGDLPAAHVRRVVLPRLTRGAVDALARSVARADGASVHAATEGNPFFVTEILRHGSDGSAVPETVRDAVLARVARLSRAAVDVVELAAIVPRRIDLPLLQAVIAAPAAAVDEAVGSGVLVAEGQALRFRHELARTAVEGSMLPTRRVELHARVLAILASHPAGDATLAALAHHAQGAGDVEAVLRWTPLAAREAAARGSRREAVAQCRAALAHASRLAPAEAAALHDELAQHLFELNDMPGTIEAREQSIAAWARLGEPAREARALAAQALSLVRALRNAEADAASRSALALVEADAAGAARAQAYATEAYLRMLNRDYDAAMARGAQAIESATRDGDRATLARAHVITGAARLFIDYAAGCAQILEGMGIAETLGDGGAATADAYVMLGSASGEVFELDAAERWLEQGIAFARARDLDRIAGYLESWQALCDVYRGRWALAGERAHEVASREAGITTNRVMALVALGRLRTRRGDPGGERVLDEALELAERSATLQRLAPVCAARAEAAWLLGRRDEAAREARRCLDLAVAKRHGWFVGELLRWTTGAGDAPAHVRAMCARPHRLELEGDWRGAATDWAARGCPYEQARALAGGDEPAQREALAILDRLGARPLADAVRRAMRQAGVRSVPRGASAAARGNPAGLTARELQVLALVAAGFRNGEIATRLSRSERTIEHHVEAILSKLQAATRTEAVAAARRLGVLD